MEPKKPLPTEPSINSGGRLFWHLQGNTDDSVDKKRWNASADVSPSRKDKPTLSQKDSPGIVTDSSVVDASVRLPEKATLRS